MEMLKKLRIKFVAIVMTIVVIILSAIFGFLYFSTARNLEMESYEMMVMLSRDPIQSRRPNVQQNGMRLPFFTVFLDDNGEISGVGGDFFDLTDEEVINEIVQDVNNSEEKFGVLKNYNLRYLVSDSAIGSFIIFTDTSNEDYTLSNLLQGFIIVGACAFLLFFAISVLLARWTVKPVENAWKQQKQFIADASHELKTPLTVIITDTELLREPECTPEEREKLTSGIMEMSVQMRGLVESLLDLARIDNHSISKQLTPVSFSDAATSSAMIFEPVFFEKKLSFSYNIEPNLNVKGNFSHLKQLLDILLDNAVKYSDEGGETKVVLKKDGHRKCILEVSNQGQPIGDTDIRNIFKRFYRADKARAMNKSYGLGLSIAQGIVAEHSGTISVESKNGFNTFTVEMPIIQ